MMQNQFLGETDFDASWEESSIIIIPVQFDLTSTWQKGADKGPEAIIQASSNLEFYDIETDFEVYKKGIFTSKPIIADTSEEMLKCVSKQVDRVLGKQKMAVCLGGEHSISLGAVEAYKKHYPDLTVVQLDAHSDLRDEYLGSKFNHACVMARIKEICPIVQIGIRSMDISEKDSIDRSQTFFAHQIQMGTSNWIDSVLALLSGPVYVTIDLDVFDSGIMPSTGTPEPGGLSWYQVTSLLKAMAGTKDIVGFDVVELCPSPINKAPDFLAAKLIYSFLSYIWR